MTRAGHAVVTLSNGLDRVYVDCFMDGRDTPPKSGIDYVAQLEGKMAEIGVGKISMISGRYYAMDRDNNYDRVKYAYDALTKGEGVTANSAAEAMQQSYDKNETDEFVKPGKCSKMFRKSENTCTWEKKPPECFLN